LNFHSSTLSSTRQIEATSSRLSPAIIEIDLTHDAPAGLDGIARIAILEENGKFSKEVTTGGFDEDDDREAFTHEDGWVESTSYTRLANGGISEGYSVAIKNEGRWSQQGFCVPHPLFADHGWRSTSKQPFVQFPFPVA
jgi:hypothetical protein